MSRLHRRYKGGPTLERARHLHRHGTRQSGIPYGNYWEVWAEQIELEKTSKLNRKK